MVDAVEIQKTFEKNTPGSTIDSILEDYIEWQP